MAEDGPERDERGRDATTAGRTPLLEIVLGAAGGGLALAVAGFFLWQAWQGDGRGPPDLRVELGAPVRLGETWLVPFTARNAGRSPAAQIRLEARLAGPAGEEAAVATLDFLAARAEAEGGFLFRRDPAAGTLSAGAAGFARP